MHTEMQKPSQNRRVIKSFSADNARHELRLNKVHLLPGICLETANAALLTFRSLSIPDKHPNTLPVEIGKWFSNSMIHRRQNLNLHVKFMFHRCQLHDCIEVARWPPQLPSARPSTLGIVGMAEGQFTGQTG